MLNLKKLRFKNLLSFGNQFTEIDFNSRKSVLIQGDNGSGKSAAILDSLSYGLFNRPFRRVNKPNIVNYKNKKDLIVEVWFSANNGKDYHIIRGLNPQIFEIYENGEMLNQNSAIRDYQEILEKSILCLDFQTFSQIAVIGKATFVAFLKLSAQDRRRFIENVLNLSIFGQMSEVNKIKVNEIKNKKQEIRTELDLLKKEIDLTQKHLSNFEEECSKQRIQYEDSIDTQIVALISKNKDLQHTRSKLNESMIEIRYEFDELNQKMETYYEYQSKLRSKYHDTQKRLVFFKENKVCPTCDSEVEESVRLAKISDFNNKLEDLSNAQNQLEKKLNSLVDLLSSMKRDVEKNVAIQNEVRVIDKTIDQNNTYISGLEKQKHSSPSAYSKQIEDAKDLLKNLNYEYLQKCDIRSQLSTQMDYHEFITTMLKDTGIKSSIIRLYVPQIQKIMNGYLHSLGLFVRFSLNENFEEKLFSRGMDELVYHSYSEGEKLRIDLAMLLTWREICKRRNNMDANFIIFDEILDASLDEQGVESLLSLFKDLSSLGVKVIVISHSDERWDERFNETWIVEKKSGFSEIKF